MPSASITRKLSALSSTHCGAESRFVVSGMLPSGQTRSMACGRLVQLAILLGSWFLMETDSLAQEFSSPRLRGDSPQAPAAPRIPAAPAMETARPSEILTEEADVSGEQYGGCIVLSNGRVYLGRLTELPQAYQIETLSGAIVIPLNEVRTVAESLEQAYQQLRDAYQRPTASDHLDLGRWCFQNQLYDAASIEAQAALGLEPSRDDAIKLLQRAEVAAGRGIKPTAETPAPYRLQTEQSMGVISAEAQRDFGRHIERLAFNKCGNGKCHGSSSLSEFKLNKNARSDLNLQSFLKFMDLDNPELSPLLIKARSVDDHHAGIFQGAGGPEQYSRLLAWVTRVSKEQSQLSPERMKREQQSRPGPFITIRPKSDRASEATSSENVATESTPRMSLETAPDISPDSTTPSSGAAIETVAAETSPDTNSTRKSRTPRPSKKAPLQSPLVQKILADQAPDAFDPEEFNRLMHGERGASAPPR